jgi:hypothetical protein
MSAIAPYGRSLHIGVNALDPACYAKYRGVLDGAENDAAFMAELARSRGFSEVRTLIGEQATAEVVLSEILETASVLPAGSLFLLTFAGHGIQKLNRVPTPTDPENYDQRWCLYDRPIIDDELRLICWPRFAPGTRVLVVVDACHSGSSVKTLFLSFVDRVSRVSDFERQRTRELPEPFVIATYRDNEERFQAIVDSLPDPRPIVAQLLALAACQDQERAGDGAHGTFTQAIKEVWDGGNFTGTHQELMAAVGTLVSDRRPSQHPATCCPELPPFHTAKAFTI